MIGLVTRLKSAVATRREDDDSPKFSDRKEGLLWVTRTHCRSCKEPIEDPTAKPTAVDRTSVVANVMTGPENRPRSTFCSEECKEWFNAEIQVST